MPVSLGVRKQERGIKEKISATYRHEVFTDAQSLGPGNRFPDFLNLSSAVVVVVIRIDASRGDEDEKKGGCDQK